MIGLFLASALAADLQGEVTERGSIAVVQSAQVWIGSQSWSVDNNGRFSIDLPEGVHRVEIRADGYLPVFLDVELPLREELSVALDVAPPPLEVVVEAERDLPHSSFQVLDRERVERTPGTHDDPGRLIQALPGVASTPEYSARSSQISIRGAAPGDSRFYFDGVELPYLFHFRQYSSVFHTRLLETVTMLPSTFGSGHGDAIGGIVESTSRSAETVDALHGGASGNMVTAGVWLQAPINENGGISASARRSHADFRENTSEWYTIWPVFWDYFGRVDQRRGEQGFSLSLFGAGDSYGRYVLQPEELGPLEKEANPPFEFDRAFHVASFRHQSASNRWSTASNLALVQDEWKGELPEASQKRLEHYLWLREDLTWGANEFLEVTAGLQAKLQTVRREVTTSRAWPELEGDAPLLSRGLSVDERLSRANGGLYLEPKFEWRGLRIQLGSRLGLDSALAKTVWDPRITWRYKSPGWWSLRGAVGQYSQAPELDDFSPITGGSELGFARSRQAALGLDLALGGRGEFSLDGWWKDLQDVLTRLPGQAPAAVDGRAWGVEFSTRYRLRNRFFTWLSVNLGESLRDGAPFEYDQPFALNFVSSWTLSKDWTLGLRYRYATGLPFTPLAHGVYDGTSNTYIPQSGTTNSERLSDYQKIDFRAERTWRFQRWTLAAYLEAWYVPSKNNSMYVVYSYDYSQRVFAAGPSFVPLVGLRGEL